MRRVVLMALLALALPMAAFADSIVFSDAGTLNSTGTLTGGATASYTGLISNGSSYTLNVPMTQFTDDGVANATATTMTLSIPTLTAIAGGYSFAGTVTVYDNSATPIALFSSSITGTIGVTGSGKNTFTTINGVFPGLPGTVGGINNMINIVNTSGSLKGLRSVSGSGNAVTDPPAVVPEPGTLGLLGTGLVGIAGLIRRKTRIG